MDHVRGKGLLARYCCGSLEVTGSSQGHESWPELDNAVPSRCARGMAISVGQKERIGARGCLGHEGTHTWYRDTTEGRQQEEVKLG